MIGAEVKTENQMRRVADALERAAFRNFGHAAARLSKDAKESLVTAPGPSEAGTPPHTHKGAFLRRAVRYDATKEDAVIGPMGSIVGESGRAHELGEDFHGQLFDERSFMEPALEKNLDRFAADWAGSIGE
jgi:hypothetical protein